MAVNNEFSFSGALGGLIAADEVIQEQTAKKLDNQSRALDNVTKMLELSLAQKYGDRRASASTRSLEATASKGESEARVAGATEQDKVRQSANQTTISDINAKYQEQGVVMGIEKDAAAVRSSNQSVAESEALLPERINQSRAAAYASRTNAQANIKQMEVAERNAISQNAYRTEMLKYRQTELDRAIILNKTQLERLEQQAQTDKDNTSIKRLMLAEQEKRTALDGQRVDLAKDELAIKRSTAEWNNLYLASQAMLNQSKVGGKANPYRDMTNEKINGNLGISSDKDFVDGVVDMLALDYGDGDELVTEKGQYTAEGSYVASMASTSLGTYKQLLKEGKVGPLDRGSLALTIKSAAAATLFDKDNKLVMSRNDHAQNTWWNHQLGALQSLGHHPSALVQTYKLAQEKGYQMHPTFAMLWSVLRLQSELQEGANRVGRREPAGVTER